MHSARPMSNANTLQGWRAHAWAWVLFAALVKGLIPHAALAGAVMTGDPALVWCAPGKVAGSSEAGASGAIAGAEHGCVCAASGDGGVLPGHTVSPLAPTVVLKPQPLLLAAASKLRPWPPPARGPPML